MVGIKADARELVSELMSASPEAGGNIFADCGIDVSHGFAPPFVSVKRNSLRECYY